MSQTITLSMDDLARIEMLIDLSSTSCEKRAAHFLPGSESHDYWAAERDADAALLQRYRAARDKADA